MIIVIHRQISATGLVKASLRVFCLLSRRLLQFETCSLWQRSQRFTRSGDFMPCDPADDGKKPQTETK